MGEYVWSQERKSGEDDYRLVVGDQWFEDLHNPKFTDPIITKYYDDRVRKALLYIAKTTEYNYKELKTNRGDSTIIYVKRK